MSKVKRAVFEWGGRKFSDQDGLRDILSAGYFREGNAWGSIRCGWEVALPWTAVCPLLERASGSKMGAYPGAGLGRESLSRVPDPIKQGDMRLEGQRLWLSMWTAGFVAAAPEMWALCEAWQIDQSAGSARAPLAKGSKRGAAKAVQAAPAGPRRL